METKRARGAGWRSWSAGVLLTGASAWALAGCDNRGAAAIDPACGADSDTDAADPTESDEPVDTDPADPGDRPGRDDPAYPYNDTDPGAADAYLCGWDTSGLLPCANGTARDECDGLYLWELSKAHQLALNAHTDITASRDPFLRLHNAGYYFALVDQEDQRIAEWQTLLSALAKYATDLRQCLRGMEPPE